jgi:hypothetical protein
MQRLGVVSILNEISRKTLNTKHFHVFMFEVFRVLKYASNQAQQRLGVTTEKSSIPEVQLDKMSVTSDGSNSTTTSTTNSISQASNSRISSSSIHPKKLRTAIEILASNIELITFKRISVYAQEILPVLVKYLEAETLILEQLKEQVTPDGIVLKPDEKYPITNKFTLDLVKSCSILTAVMVQEAPAFQSLLDFFVFVLVG